MRLLLACLALFAATGAARAEYVISAYGGTNFSFDSTVDVANGPSTRSLDVSWDGRSFESGAPYYGLRATAWLNDLGRPNWASPWTTPMPRSRPTRCHQASPRWNSPTGSIS